MNLSFALMKVPKFNLFGRLVMLIAMAFFGVTTSSRADLIALYRFENSTTADETSKLGTFSGNTYNGTAVGDAVSLSTDVSGVNGGSKSLSLGGSGDYVTLPISAVNPFDGSQSYTITCWFKQADLAGNNMIILSSARDTSSGNHAMAFFLHNSPEGNLRTDNYFINQNNVGSGLDDNNWHFGAVTYEPGTGFRLRVDNTYSSTVNFDPAIPSISGDTVIIGDTLNTAFPTPGDFAGLLDDVAIFNHKLSDAELDNVKAGDFSAYVTYTPEIDVTGNDLSIASGDTTPSTTDHTDFGSTIVNGGTITRTFTITNSGGGILNLSGASKVAISGAGASHFSVTQPSFSSGSVSIVNAGFEYPVYSAGGWNYQGGYNFNGDSNAGWTFGTSAGIARNGSPWFVNSAPEGSQAAFIQNNSVNAYFSQSLSFPAAGVYDVTFYVVRRSSGYPGNDIDVRVDGASIGTVQNTVQTSDTWASYTYYYYCPSAGSHTLSFVGLRGGGDYGSAIDNVTVTRSQSRLGPGESKTFQVQFAPTSTGAQTATLTIANDDSDEGTYAFDITGSASSSSLPSGAVAWWRAENNANDSIGSNNGTLNGGATYTTGHIGNAFSFNTVGDNITVPDSASLDLSGSFTIEAWVYLTNRTSHYMIVTKAPSVGPSNYPGNYELRVTPTTGYLELGFEYSGGLNFWTSTTAVPLNQWSHVAVVYTSGTSVEFFVDGVSSGMSSTTRTPLVNNSTLRIAARADGYSFNGAIDELTLFSRALTSTEIQHIAADDYLAAEWDGATGTGNGADNGSPDQLRIRRNGTNIEFSGDGGTSWSATLPYASTTVLTLTGSSDDDTFVIDFSGGNPIPSGGITVAGGSQVTGDKLQVTGGAFGTVTHNLLTANDGNLVIAGMGTINYTGLEPVDMTGSTITDLVFNLPAGPSNAILEDDGTAANGISRFRSSPVTFESTDFTDPSGSVTINRGNASDTLTINDTPDFTASLTVGGTGTEFSTVTIAGTLSLSTDKNLSVNASGTVSFSTTSSDVALLGTGAASITTLRNIAFASGSSLTAVNGNLTLSANAAGGSGDFIGVDVNGGLIQATGTGVVSVTGKGSTGGAGSAPGIYVRNGGDIIGGTAGTMTLNGTAGTSTSGLEQIGVYIIGSGSTVDSGGANVSVSGTGSASSTGNSLGFGIYSSAVLRAGSGGTVTVVGVGGATTSAGATYNLGITVESGGTITSVNGNVSVTGTGGAATGGFNHGVSLQSGGIITAGNAANTVTVTGTGGAGTGTGSSGVVLNSSGANSISSAGGNLTVTGTAGTSGSGFEILGASTSVSTPAAGGNITITADTMNIAAGAITVNNAANSATLRQLTNGKAINLGGADSGTQLGLTDAELDRVTAGTINIGNSSTGVITVSAAITHLNGNAIVLDNNATTINLNAGITTSGGAITLSDPAVLGGNITLDATNGGGTPGGAAISFASTVNLGSNLLTLNGGSTDYSIGTVISGTGGQLTKLGAGTLTLSGANTFTGNVIVSAGTLKIGNITALGAANTAVTKVTVASGAAVDFNGVVDARYGYTISGTGVGGTGALVNTGAAIPNGNLQCSNIKLGADAAIGGTGAWSLLTAAYGATTLDLSGFTLTKIGNNTIYLCNTTVTAGTVQISAGTLGVVRTAVDGSAAAFVLDNTAGARLSLTDDLASGAANLSVGSLSGGGATGGNVALGAVALTAGALNTSTTYAGVISGTGGQLTKTGTGTLTLTGSSTYTGATAVNGGKLLVNGSLSTSSAVTVATGGTLGGSGTVGAVVVQSGGTLAPGASPGIFNVGNLTLNSGSTLNIELDGTTPGTGYDRLNVTGTVSLGGATVVFSGTHGFLPGDTFTFILNDSTDAVTGTFSGLAEGAQISNFLSSGTIATISYIGGTGNDVTLTISGTPATWSADTANGNGSNNATSDSLRIRRNGSEIQFSADDGATWPTFVVYDKTSVLTLQGSGDDDKFVVDYSGGNPIPYGGVVLVGAGQVTTGDYLEMLSGSHTTVTYTFVNNNDGSVDVDGNLISYTGLEPIFDNTDAVNRVFDFTGGAETITVKSASATQTFVDSTLGESVTFNNPTASMIINAGTGDDRILFNSLSSGWAAAVTLNGGAGDDTFYLNKTVSTSAAITLNGDAHATGDVLSFDREGDTAITSSGASPGTISGGSPAIQTVNYDTVETINMYLYGSPGDYVIADRGPYFSTGTILLYKAASGLQQVVDTTIKDPYEISLDASGNFVIADYEVNAGTAGIYLIDRLTGTKSTVSSDGAFEVPFGVKADTSGGVNDGKYIVADLDADNNGASAWGALFVVDPGSASPGNQTLLSSRTAGTGTFFYWLTGLALGGSGDIYVCDQGNLSNPGTQPPRVFHVDPTTGNRTVMAQGGTMVRPVGVVVISGTGNTAQLLVVDAGSKKLLRFTGTGSPITISVTEELSHTGVTFDSPTHVAIDGSGNYVISDAPPYATAGHRRIHVMDSGTLVTTTVTSDGFLEQPRGVHVVP